MSWYRQQFVLTALLLVGSVLAIEWTGFDIALQDQLFDFATGQWLWDREEPVSRFLLYDGIKQVYVLAALGLIGVLGWLRRAGRSAQLRQRLLILCLAMFIVPITINIAKGLTNVPCPRDIEHYGGALSYATIINPFTPQARPEARSRCYPAGHASGGFALLALFFVAGNRRQRTGFVGAAMALGWITGGYKMLIGDHFFSHTLVTMLIAWLEILLIAGFVTGWTPPPNFPAAKKLQYLRNS